MDFFPAIGLYSPWYLGDSVLLEPIAKTLAERLGKEVHVVSNYPELFLEHPSVRGIRFDDVPPNMRLIDMSAAIKSLRRDGDSCEILPNKIKRMYEAAGLEQSDIAAPRLYLSADETDFANDLLSEFPNRRVGVALESRHEFKNIPHIEKVVEGLIRKNCAVFVFGAEIKGDYSCLTDLPVYRIIDRPLREAMAYLSIMDVFTGPDTGITHVAAALGIDTVPITRDIWRDLYEIYLNATIISTKVFSANSFNTFETRTGRIVRTVCRQLEAPVETKKPKAAREKKVVALFRLDGLGGTVTLADQAKKIFEQTGIKSVPIVRNYRDLFADNPHIADVVEVGYVKWNDTLADMLDQYDTLAEIRFAPAKWHQRNGRLFEQDFSDMEGMFAEFPHEYRQLETHGLHHVQLTDRYLGLPYETIDMEVYCDKKYDGLPERYIIVADGVDAQHKGMRQTKVWGAWDEFVMLVDTPAIQVGTMHDPRIVGAMDLRGKTTLPELFYVLKKASGVVCIEGGIMHLSYATKTPNVFILRGPTRGKLFEYPGHRFVDSYVCDICWSSTDDWYARCPKGADAVCMDSITPERVAMNLQGVGL